MIKRVTLLRRREDLSVAEFRDHWANPHAAIARGFQGLRRYDQNRVDRCLWRTEGAGFEVDGLVELWFESEEAVASNATSGTTRALIEDEPRFLSGLTALAVGPAPLPDRDPAGRKVMILARAEDADRLARRLAERADDATIETATPAFTREALWSEPAPPNLIVTLWQDGSAGAEAGLPGFFRDAGTPAAAYAVDPLRIV